MFCKVSKRKYGPWLGQSSESKEASESAKPHTTIIQNIGTLSWINCWHFVRPWNGKIWGLVGYDLESKEATGSTKQQNLRNKYNLEHIPNQLANILWGFEEETNWNLIGLGFGEQGSHRIQKQPSHWDACAQTSRQAKGHRQKSRVLSQACPPWPPHQLNKKCRSLFPAWRGKKKTKTKKQVSVC